MEIPKMCPKCKISIESESTCMGGSMRVQRHKHCPKCRRVIIVPENTPEPNGHSPVARSA